MKKLTQIQNPEIFQGDFSLNTKHYFEGWYFKLVDKDAKRIFAIIPGVALDKKGGTSHSFIQFLDGKRVDYYYFNYPVSDFNPAKKEFKVDINQNFFSKDKMVLDIEQQEMIIKGELNFHDVVPFPKTKLNPGIMGWMSYLTFLECNHGIVSMDLDISGELIINGEKIDFNGGKGYIEKDWGKSFPENWIWIQTNHFETPNTSLFFSLATIPVFGFKFPGFISVFYFNGKHHRFATYNKSKITHLEIGEEFMEVIMENDDYILEIKGKKAETEVKNDTAMMKAPIAGQMTGKCLESMTSKISVKFYSKSENKILFEEIGENAGFELMATLEGLKMEKKFE